MKKQLSQERDVLCLPLCSNLSFDNCIKIMPSDLTFKSDNNIPESFSACCFGVDPIQCVSVKYIQIQEGSETYSLNM